MADKLTVDDAEETLTETVEINGEKKEIDVVPGTVSEIRELEQKEENGDLSEDEANSILWDKYLDTPDIAYEDAPTHWLRPVTEGIYRAWGLSGSAIDEAMDEFDPDEATGN